VDHDIFKFYGCKVWGRRGRVDVCCVCSFARVRLSLAFLRSSLALGKCDNTRVLNARYVSPVVHASELART